VALAIGMTVAAAGGQSASATGRPAYMNPRLPVQARVADLLGRMTLPEKIGQMVQILCPSPVRSCDHIGPGRPYCMNVINQRAKKRPLRCSRPSTSS
jgi:hypothetical protein